MAKTKEPKLQFNGKTDQEQAILEFMHLKEDQAWKRIVKYLDQKCEYFDNRLRGEIEGEEIKCVDEMKRVQERRKLAMQMRNLPDILMGFIQLSKGEKLELDPYSTADEIGKTLDIKK